MDSMEKTEPDNEKYGSNFSRMSVIWVSKK